MLLVFPDSLIYIYIYTSPIFKKRHYLFMYMCGNCINSFQFLKLVIKTIFPLSFPLRLFCIVLFIAVIIANYIQHRNQSDE